MKRFYAIAAIIGAAMTIASCGSYTYLETVDHKETSEKALEFTNSHVMTTPFVADIQLLDPENPQMVEIVVEEPFKDYDVTSQLIKLIPEFKGIALTQALKDLREDGINADLLLGVLFNVETDFKNGKNMPGKLRITVRGYPAKYTNFRTASDNDVDKIYKATAARNMEKPEAVIDTYAPQHNTTLLKENIQHMR